MSHWVLQSGWEHETGWVTMLDTLRRFDIPFSLHKVVPFVGDLEPEPEPMNYEVICMGSYSMRHYAKKKGWNPGVFDIAGQNFREQRAHWGDAMLNADSIVAAFGDVHFQGKRFVRPIEDNKAFTGAMFEWEEFSEWQRGVVANGEAIGNSLTADMLVQVAPPKSIGQEVRCWVVEGRVVTASVYRAAGRVVYSDQVEPRVVAFATEQAERWSPAKAFCMDVGETIEGLRIVEINTINSAGFYAADTQKLVMALDGLKQ